MSDIFQDKAKALVVAHANKRKEKTDDHIPQLSVESVYVVWFCKTLQNWKALLSTSWPDGMYYEVTYDGDKRQAYVDSYKKWENSAYPEVDFA